MNPVFEELNAGMFDWSEMWEPVYFSLNALSQYCFPPLPLLAAAPLDHPLIPPVPCLGPEDDVVEILMIGYPDGKKDSFHKLPLMRKGIISSDFTLPFEGREEFIIDMESTRGSSGSPVLYRKKTDNPLRPIEYYLLGIFFLHHRSDGYIEGVTHNDPSFNLWERLQAQHLDAQVRRFKHYFKRSIYLGNVIKSSQLNLDNFN